MFARWSKANTECPYSGFLGRVPRVQGVPRRPCRQNAWDFFWFHKMNSIFSAGGHRGNMMLCRSRGRPSNAPASFINSCHLLRLSSAF